MLQLNRPLKMLPETLQGGDRRDAGARGVTVA